MVPPPNSDADFTLSLTVRGDETIYFYEESFIFPINMQAVADPPTLTARPRVGDQFNEAATHEIFPNRILDKTTPQLCP